MAMFTDNSRRYHVQTFESLVQGNYFAQIYNEKRTRVVHETGLYPSKRHAIGAARDWARYSESALAKSLETHARI